MAWLEARGAQVVGVDVSTGMLRTARAAVRGALVEADMRSLPFADGSFDAVWCMAALLHVPKVEAAGVLSEIARVLADGGLLALGLRQGTGEGWQPGPPGWHERYFALYEADELAGLLRAAGFVAGAIDANDGGHARWLTTIATRTTVVTRV
jgi:ubiquinone/menaquinone biosynthesis C-methylase UbiE